MEAADSALPSQDGFEQALSRERDQRCLLLQGRGAASWSTWSAHLPVFLDGKYGTVQLFWLPGNTPMLRGRPIIESLGITMDFAMKRIRFGSSEWCQATIDRQDECLLSFIIEHDYIIYDPDHPEFCLRTAEPNMAQEDDLTLNDF